MSALWQTPASSQGPRELVTPSGADREVDAQLSADADRQLSLADRPTPTLSSSGRSFAIYRPSGQAAKRMRPSGSASCSGDRFDRLLREVRSCRVDIRCVQEGMREEIQHDREENRSLHQKIADQIDGALLRVADTVAAVITRQDTTDARVSGLDERQQRTDIQVADLDERQLRSDALNADKMAKIDAQFKQLQEQNSERNNECKLVIRCVPGSAKMSQFDLKALVMKMSSSMGLRLADRTVKYVKQILNTARKQSTLLVEFDDRASRTAFFNVYLAKRDLDARHLGFATASRIYVGEMLTKTMSEVRDHAIQLKKAGKLIDVKTINNQVWVTAVGGARSRPSSLQELQAAFSG